MFLLLCFCLLTATALASVCTVPVAPLSEPREYYSATSVAGRFALFAGGYRSSTVDVFDALSGSWSTSQLSGERYLMAATSLGDVALFAGGVDFSEPTTFSDAVDAFDARTGLWNRSTPLSEKRSGLAAATARNVTLFAGGRGPTGPTATVDRFDWLSGNWSSSSADALSQPRELVVGVGLRKWALFAGGESWGTMYAVVDMWNAETQVWQLANLSEARSRLSSVAVRDRFAIFAGGALDILDNVSAAVDVFDAETATWLAPLALSAARAYLTASALGPFALFAGGKFGASGSTSDAVDVLDSATWTFTARSLSGPRSRLAATSVGGIALVGGGYVSGRTYTPAVDAFTLCASSSRPARSETAGRRTTTLRTEAASSSSSSSSSAVNSVPSPVSAAALCTLWL